MNEFWTIFLMIGAVMWLFSRFGGSRRGPGCGRPRMEREPRRSESEDQMAERLTEMSARIDRLEEERDFYRDLLSSSRKLRQSEPESGRAESFRP
jgi:hypothetical protein